MKSAIGGFLSLAMILAAATSLAAHEGHQPLPTKGVQVDLAKGHITLSRSARNVIDVQTAEVERRENTERLRAYATVVAPWTRYAVITSRLPGRVTALHVRPGDTVKAGQIVAEIDSLDLHTLRLDYQQARNNVALSGKILEGLGPAAHVGAIAGQRLIEAQRTHRQNLNELDVLQAKAVALGVAEDQLKDEDSSQPLRLAVTAGIGGIVVHADLAVGKYVEPTEHLMDVVDVSTVWVKIGILERDWHRVAIGQKVRLSVSSLPEQVFETTIDKLGLRLDPQTRESIAWAEFKNSSESPKLRPGMNGQVEVILSDQKPTLTVPRQAILSDGAERYVLVEEASTKDGAEYQKVSVVIGRQTSQYAAILAGKVLPGDRVVTRGGHELSSLFFLGVLRVGKETARTIGLKVEPATSRAVERILALDGAMDILPQQRTTVSSQLEGKIVGIRVDRGQTVKAGDVLAEIASLALQDLQLNLLRSQLDYDMWKDLLMRQQKTGNALPRRVLLETESQARTFEIQRDNARQKLLMLGLTSDQISNVITTKKIVQSMPLRATIDGAVVHFDRTLGQIVKADEAVFEIHDISRITVQAFLGERDSSQVHAGQTARIRLVAFPALEVAGTVTRIGPIIGIESRIQSAWIEIPQLPGVSLQQNMSARVTLTIGQSSPVLAVPANALIRDGLRSFLFVQKPDGTFERRRVEVGRSDDRYFEIKRGISRGELIAIGGVTQLQTAYSALR